jgi:hypothetical protein
MDKSLKIEITKALIISIIPVLLIGYGIGGIVTSKNGKKNKRAKVFLSTGIVSLIIGIALLLLYQK